MCRSMDGIVRSKTLDFLVEARESSTANEATPTLR